MGSKGLYKWSVSLRTNSVTLVFGAFLILTQSVTTWKQDMLESSEQMNLNLHRIFHSTVKNSIHRDCHRVTADIDGSRSVLLLKEGYISIFAWWGGLGMVCCAPLSWLNNIEDCNKLIYNLMSTTRSSSRQGIIKNIPGPLAFAWWDDHYINIFYSI